MNITVVGTGYVGLVTGTCFAEMGYDVVCVDSDEEKVSRLSAGQLTIYEPSLDLLFKRNTRERRLHFTTALERGVKHGDVIFLSLPTPPASDGSADLSAVVGVAHSVAELLASTPAVGYKVIVNKSTVPVGTADRVTAIFEDAGLTPGRDVDVVSNPEFLREGRAVSDFMKPDRVVIGTSSRRAAHVMTELYEPFVRQGNPIVRMAVRSAEMTKYASNAFLATKISFMNEIANVCDRVDANIDEVRIGMGLDGRIGKHFLFPGIGFGGSCFPKDVQALGRTAITSGYEFEILRSVLRVNDRQRSLLARKAIDAFDGNVRGRRMAVWGLAFKPDTDDIREAPAHVVIDALVEAGAIVSAFDPEAMQTTRAVFGDAIEYADDAYAATRNADALLICTEWPEFRRPDFELLRSLMSNRLILDGRNLYDPARMATLGFEYISIGRPFAKAKTDHPRELATNGRH